MARDQEIIHTAGLHRESIASGGSAGSSINSCHFSKTGSRGTRDSASDASQGREIPETNAASTADAKACWTSVSDRAPHRCNVAGHLTPCQRASDGRDANATYSLAHRLRGNYGPDATNESQGNR